MNFLLNMNIPRTLGPLLEREGYRFGTSEISG